MVHEVVLHRNACFASNFILKFRTLLISDTFLVLTRKSSFFLRNFDLKLYSQKSLEVVGNGANSVPQ